MKQTRNEYNTRPVTCTRQTRNEIRGKDKPDTEESIIETNKKQNK